MEEKDRLLAQRYREWIDCGAIPDDSVRAVWRRISAGLERERSAPGTGASRPLPGRRTETSAYAAEEKEHG